MHAVRVKPYHQPLIISSLYSLPIPLTMSSCTQKRPHSQIICMHPKELTRIIITKSAPLTKFSNVGPVQEKSFIPLTRPDVGRSNFPWPFPDVSMVAFSGSTPPPQGAIADSI